MKCRDIMKVLNGLAPFEAAEEWDNVGLLIGDEEEEIHTIMLALDPTEQVIRQAVEQSVDLLITHHPLIFRGEKHVVMQESIGRRIAMLLQNNVSAIAMHTNYDAAHMALDVAEMIHLQKEAILDPDRKSVV